MKATKDDHRIIGSDNLFKLETWIYAFHTLHELMRGDRKWYISCGVGIIHVKSLRKKVNTKINTESEVVAVSEYVPTFVWITTL